MFARECQALFCHFLPHTLQAGISFHFLSHSVQSMWLRRADLIHIPICEFWSVSAGQGHLNSLASDISAGRLVQVKKTMWFSSNYYLFRVIFMTHVGPTCLTKNYISWFRRTFLSLLLYVNKEAFCLQSDCGPNRSLSEHKSNICWGSTEQKNPRKKQA